MFTATVPTAFPRDMAPWRILAAMTANTSSGRVVPKATRIPTNRMGSRNAMAPSAASVTMIAELTIRRNAPTTKRMLSRNIRSAAGDATLLTSDGSRSNARRTAK